VAEIQLADATKLLTDILSRDIPSRFIEEWELISIDDEIKRLERKVASQEEIIKQLKDGTYNELMFQLKERSP